MIDIICYWAPDARLWICYCVDADGNQIYEADFYPNRERMKEAWIR